MFEYLSHEFEEYCDSQTIFFTGEFFFKCIKCNMCITKHKNGNSYFRHTNNDDIQEYIINRGYSITVSKINILSCKEKIIKNLLE